MDNTPSISTNQPQRPNHDNLMIMPNSEKKHLVKYKKSLLQRIAIQKYNLGAGFYTSWRKRSLGKGDFKGVCEINLLQTRMIVLSQK